MFRDVLRYNYSIVNRSIFKKKYILSQFPYPSGDLHLGHARVYYIGDAISKYYKLKNNQVIYPIGWDSFGLPAQNAAILHGKNPKQWTQNNIERMRNQLLHLDIQFNWQMELSTSQPQYYKWTQQIFVKMFKKGLAYKNMAQVNWDPVDKTVLANQQVDENGHSWRSGAKVQKKMLNQWFFKITHYAQKLQNNLDQINWIQKVKNMQKGWINFKIFHKLKLNLLNQQKTQIQVYFQQIDEWKQVSFIIKKLNNASQINQRGQKIVGKIKNPLNGKSIVVMQSKKQQSQHFILINLKKQKGQSFYKDLNEQFKKQIQECSKIDYSLIQSDSLFLQKIQKVQYMKLKDWLISRQRYWGCPIPIIYCKNCGTIPVPEQQLPILLPQWKNDGNPLIKDSFKKCKCPKCGNQQAQRQSDTMDTFVDSSWYFLRFIDNKNKNKIFDKQQVQKMMPVDVYIGGIQHAIMHLLYARFIMRFIKDEYQLNQNCHEPFKELVVQGLVKGKTLSLKSNGKYISQAQLDSGKYSLQDVNVTYQKMSKSKFNGLNPNILVDKYGSDALKVAIFFANPPDRDIDFSQQIVINADKFLKKVQNLWVQLLNKTNKINKKHELIDTNNLLSLKKIFQKMQISIQKRLMHTYIANVMEMFNLIKQLIDNYKYKLDDYQKIKIFCIFVRVLQIIAPKLSNKIKQEATNKFPQFFSKQQFNIWPNDELFGQKIEILIMKGRKMIGKDTVKISMTQQQIIKTLKIDVEVLQIKKQKKKYVVILKQ